MNRFARLFDFNNGQLLLTVSEIADIPGTTPGNASEGETEIYLSALKRVV